MFSWESEVLSLMDGGHSEQALARLRELESQTEDDSEELSVIRLNEAACLRELGHFKEALRLFQELNKSANASTNDRCLYLLSGARCLERLEQFRKARRWLREIRHLDTSGDFAIDVEFVEISIQFAEGKIDEAINNAKLLLNKYKEELCDPEYTESTYKLELRMACELVNAQQYCAALDAIHQLLPKAKERDRGLLYLYLGGAHQALGESSEAIKALQQVLREGGAQESLARANYRLGAEYLKSGATAWAKQHFLEAERLGLPSEISSKDLYQFLANACTRLAELEERDKYLRLARQ